MLILGPFDDPASPVAGRKVISPACDGARCSPTHEGTMVNHICEICRAWCVRREESARRICGACADIESIPDPEKRRRAWMVLDEAGVVKVPEELLGRA